jgi:hypothetical protein
MTARELALVQSFPIDFDQGRDSAYRQIGKAAALATGFGKGISKIYIADIDCMNGIHLQKCHLMVTNGDGQA